MIIETAPAGEVKQRGRRSYVKTPEDAVAQANLKVLWEARRRRFPEISQMSEAPKMGMSQGCFSQYLCGKVPITLTALMNFSRYFGVKPSDIRPEFADRDAESTNRALIAFVERATEELGRLEASNDAEGLRQLRQEGKALLSSVSA